MILNLGSHLYQGIFAYAMSVFLVLFIKCNDHCSNYPPLKKCSDIVLNIHINSSSYYDAVDCLLQCYGLTFHFK